MENIQTLPTLFFWLIFAIGLGICGIGICTIGENLRRSVPNEEHFFTSVDAEPYRKKVVVGKIQIALGSVLAIGTLLYIFLVR